jgi:hypothetical protein
MSSPLRRGHPKLLCAGSPKYPSPVLAEPSGVGEGISWIDIAASAAGIQSQVAALGREAAAAFSQEFNNATRSALGQSGRGFSDAGCQGAQLFGDAFTAGLAGRYYPTALRSVRADALQGLDAPERGYVEPIPARPRAGLPSDRPMRHLTRCA